MLKILYEDNHIIVVEKEPNIPSQGDKTEDIDMLTLVKRYIKEKYQKPGEVSVKWKKNDKVTGYQLQYSTDKNFKKGVKTVTVKKNGTVATTIPKLAKGNTYFVRIRTYNTVSKKNYYSNWSKSRNVKIIK